MTRILFAIWIAFLIGCGDIPPKPGHDDTSPVTNEMLIGTQLTDIRQPDLTWDFADSLVVIQNKDQPIPSDLVEALLGDQSTCRRIEATWTTNSKDRVLRLSSMKVDGEDIGKEATISIEPAGKIRVNIGTRQYNRNW